MKRLPQLLILLTLLNTCGGCALLRWEPRSGPPLPLQPPLRKQVLGDFMPFGSIAWVNDRELVFTGKPSHAQQGFSGVYLWDLKRLPRLLLQDSTHACVSNGIIKASQLRKPGRGGSFRFSPPDYSARRVPPSRPPGLRVITEPISCTSIAVPEIFRNRIWKPLRLGEGFLDFGPQGNPAPSPRPVELLSADLRERRDTGIRMPQPWLPQAVHAAHDGSYLIYDLNISEGALARWHREGMLRIWRLDRNGRGRPLEVPAGLWSAQDIGFLPARPGLLIRSNNFDRRGRPEGAGLYLLRPGAPAQRLERGLVEDAALSPDGCRVAYGFRPRLDTSLREGGPRLVVVDLCAVTPGRDAPGKSQT